MIKCENRVLTSLLLCVKVRVKGRGQGHGPRSKVMVDFLVRTSLC